MIAETSAYLTAALGRRDGRAAPRIPTRRVDLGGFSALMRRNPLARVAATHFWVRALGSTDLD